MKFTLDNEVIEYGSSASTAAIQAALNLHGEGKLTAKYIDDNFLLHHLAALNETNTAHVVKLFVSLGANTNLVDKVGNTPLHIILMIGQLHDFSALHKEFITLQTKLDLPFGILSDNVLKDHPQVAKLMKNATIPQYGEAITQARWGNGEARSVSQGAESKPFQDHESKYRRFMTGVVAAQGEGAKHAVEMLNVAPNPEVEYLAKRIVWDVKSDNTSSLANIEESPLCLDAINLLRKQNVEGQNWVSLQGIAKSNSHLAEIILGNMEQAAKERSGR
jgi:hypothetical protein